MDTQQHWMAIAVSEQVNDQRPLAVSANGYDLAVFRNAEGRACVVENRCPHRRVPLTLGKIIDGNIRCAYHGWTFEGLGGKCVAVPNLGEDERVSPNFCIKTYPVVEQDGFVSVWPGEGEPPACAAFASLMNENPGHELSGSGAVPIAFDQYRAILFDGPQLLFDIPGVRVTDFYLGDVVERAGALVIDREAEWGDSSEAADIKITDRPLILRTELSPPDDRAVVSLLDTSEQVLARLLLSFYPGKRGTTGMCWRFASSASLNRARPWRLRLSLGRRPPVRVFRRLDGEAVSDLLVGPSRDAEALMARWQPGQGSPAVIARSANENSPQYEGAQQ